MKTKDAHCTKRPLNNNEKPANSPTQVRNTKKFVGEIGLKPLLFEGFLKDIDKIKLLQDRLSGDVTLKFKRIIKPFGGYVKLFVQRVNVKKTIKFVVDIAL